jgi:two-component system, cell cycle response regulator DivK
VTTVAVVEDNADNRLLVRAIIGDAYDVREFTSGDEALDAFARAAPDVVLLDISLPGLSGLEVLARLRADARLARVPVVALTAHAMDGDRQRYLAAGFDGYVSKPILDETVLLDAIARALRRPGEGPPAR